MFVGTLSSHLSFLKALKSHQAPAEFRRRWKRFSFFVPESDEVIHVERDLREENLNEVSA